VLNTIINTNNLTIFRQNLESFQGMHVYQSDKLLTEKNQGDEKSRRTSLKENKIINNNKNELSIDTNLAI
jgi:hypothetical protein